ncbi:hypothetical protein [Domibacillus epiphyticus]|uniref:hypothetical protein n=1 Tax=Domibacillus epiphyticus TaxID=1714355 RepID=UPI001E322299|nr:hypothetical protein [Domibacillus epiphyticus]
MFAKALNEQHEKVLKKLERIGLSIRKKIWVDELHISAITKRNEFHFSKDYNLEEIKTPPVTEKSLWELGTFRARYNVSIIAIIQNGDMILSPPSNQISSDRQKGKFVVICKCRIIRKTTK